MSALRHKHCVVHKEQCRNEVNYGKKLKKNSKNGNCTVHGSNNALQHSDKCTGSRIQEIFQKDSYNKRREACQITLETKRATSVTVNVSLTKSKNTFVVINLNEQQSEMFQVPNGQLTVELEKGKYQLLVSNQAQKKVKAKVSVSADKAVLKYKSQKTTNALDSLG